MAKENFYYNPETLSYEKVTVTIKERLRKWTVMFASSIVIAVIYYVLYSHFYDTPKERMLNNQLANIKFNYQMLSQDLNHIDMILADIQKRDDDVYRTILESDPIPASIRQAGFGGVNRFQALEGYLNSNLMIKAAMKTEKILKQLYVQSLSYDELIYKAINKEQMILSRPAIQPISNKDLRSRISGFGWRKHPILGYGRPHTGIDFPAPTGTPIYATGNGTVIRTEWNSGGYGRMVTIDHGFGIVTRYAHMHTIGVLEGSEVKRGDIIGTVGNTGLSVSSHLHYEVLVNGRHVNPISYFYGDLSPDEYVQLVQQSLENDILEQW